MGCNHQEPEAQEQEPEEQQEQPPGEPLAIELESDDDSLSSLDRQWFMRLNTTVPPKKRKYNHDL